MTCRCPYTVASGHAAENGDSNHFRAPRSVGDMPGGKRLLSPFSAPAQPRRGPDSVGAHVGATRRVALCPHNGRMAIRPYPHAVLRRRAAHTPSAY